MRRNLGHHHPGWDKARAIKDKVAATRQRSIGRTRPQSSDISSSDLQFSSSSIPDQARSNDTDRQIQSMKILHHRNRTTAGVGLQDVQNRRRKRAAPIINLEELDIPEVLSSSSSTTDNKVEENDIEGKGLSKEDVLEQANFKISELSNKCQEQQKIIDKLFSNIQKLQEEDENRMNEIRSSFINLQNMTRKYDEDILKKFHSQQDSHYKRVQRMETSTIKNIKYRHDKIYKSHSTDVAQQRIFIQENIDQTSGKQRKMIISLTSKGVHWFAMGAMTIVGPCFKLLRCCGVRKTKLSEFAKDYLGADGEFEVPE
jgi:hypothetical protein